MPINLSLIVFSNSLDFSAEASSSANSSRVLCKVSFWETVRDDKNSFGKITLIVETSALFAGNFMEIAIESGEALGEKRIKGSSLRTEIFPLDVTLISE